MLIVGAVAANGVKACNLARRRVSAHLHQVHDLPPQPRSIVRYSFQRDYEDGCRHNVYEIVAEQLFDTLI